VWPGVPRSRAIRAAGAAERGLDEGLGPEGTRADGRIAAPGGDSPKPYNPSEGSAFRLGGWAEGGEEV